MVFKMFNLNFNASCKGRNGFFKARRVDVLQMSPIYDGTTVCVDIWSRNQTRQPPIEMRLTSQDAIKIGHMFTAAGMGVLKDD